MTRRRTTGRRLAAVVPATLFALVVMGAPSALAATGNGHGTSADATTASSGHAAKGKSAGHATKSSSDKGSSQASSHTTSGTAGTSGDPTQPQPISRGDQNSGGANGQCTGATYCSTRDGSPSGNGNGGGKATGRPCAGCVGKADNKNPPGQEKTDPRGTFPNNGYECDNNNGIGKTNPAHTGCTATTSTCPEGEVMGANGECTTPGGSCGDDESAAAGDCTPPPSTCPAGEVVDTTTGACSHPDQCVPTQANSFCSNVEGEQHHRPSSHGPTTSVEGEHFVHTPAVSPTGAGVLPFTGAAALTWLLSSGTMLLALGGALLALAARRRRTT